MRSKTGAPLRFGFDRSAKIRLLGAKVSSDAGLLAYRAPDERLGLTQMAAEQPWGLRRGKNVQHSMLALIRQARCRESRLSIANAALTNRPQGGTVIGLQSIRDFATLLGISEWVRSIALLDKTALEAEPVSSITQLVAMVAILFLAAAPFAAGMTIYVDVDSKRPGDGSRQAPFRTIQQAADLLKPGDECRIKGGTYRETVVPARSGSADQPIVFRPYENEQVVISGCEKVEAWQKVRDHVYKAKVSMPLGHENQVFADGRMMFEARWPNAGGTDQKHLLEFKMATMKEGTTPTRIVDDALPAGDWIGAMAWVNSHKRWSCWTGKVTGSGAGYVEVEDNSDEKGNHVCRKGGKYYLFGIKRALDSENEWYYDADAGELYVWMPDGGDPAGRVEVKRRMYAFDLRGKSHIELRNLHIHAGSVRTDERSRNLVLDGLRAEYVYHSSGAVRQYGSQKRTGIVLNGDAHVVRNCEIAYSSGSCLVLSGHDYWIVNNYIHDGDYIGTFASPVVFAGGTRGHVFSHNTVTRAGRATLGTGSLHDCLVQHNELSYAGYLTDDLGLTYGNGVEGGNSEVRYNWLHHNVADGKNMGLYFDHGCKNLIFHHNAIWAVDFAGIINNHYGNYLLYYNNTVADARHSYRSTWNAGQEKDLYGCRMFNNVGTADMVVDAAGLASGSNSWDYHALREKKFLSPGTEPVDSAVMIPGITDDYVGAAPDRGAYELGAPPWKAGHDFQNPPTDINTARSLPPHRNLIENAAFYGGELGPWEEVGEQVTVIFDPHNQWVADARAMMGGYSVRLGEGRNGLRQRVTGLKPETTYELMAMFRVDEGESARLSVHNYGRPEKHSEPVAGNAPEWARRTLRFTTGPGHRDAVIVLEKTSPGDGEVYVDDPGLQLIAD